MPLGCGLYAFTSETSRRYLKQLKEVKNVILFCLLRSMQRVFVSYKNPQSSYLMKRVVHDLPTVAARFESDLCRRLSLEEQHSGTRGEELAEELCECTLERATTETSHAKQLCVPRTIFYRYSSIAPMVGEWPRRRSRRLLLYITAFV